MEEVTIQSQLLGFDTTSLLVELKMFNKDKTELKALMWSNYVHFNLMEQKREQHEERFMELFSSVLNPVPEARFEERVLCFKKTKG